MNDLVARADQALSRDLCDHCLGRLFAQVSTGLTDQDRGRMLRAAVSLARERRGERGPEHIRCWLCDEVFENLDRFVASVEKALRGLEFGSFLVGTRVDPTIQEREERLWAEVGGATAETIKAELNREIGKRLEAKLEKPVEFSTPDVVAIVDTRFSHVTLDLAPMFVYGRYIKLSREIPQTRWPCKKCGGKGCERCQFTGKMYPTSVQEIIGDPLMEMAEGEEHLFHGMGREDIDALMLGNGRPFVLEVRNPRSRNIDLRELERTINQGTMVKVLDLRPSSREEVRKVKMSSPDKTYRVAFRPDGKVDKQKLNEVVRSSTNLTITQQTPLRVAHRRADKARERRIKKVRIESLQENEIVLLLTTESGTYVKEWVHGDQGRTVPSLSQALGASCQVLWLDVIGIADEATEG